jgi:hypothetical protein
MCILDAVQDPIEIDGSRNPKIVNCVKSRGTEIKEYPKVVNCVKGHGTKIKESINGKGDTNADTRQKKRSRDLKPVVDEKTKLPFLHLLSEIEIEANIPLAFENIFENQEKSQEDKDLEEMWKDMELALNGKTLSSGSKVSNFGVLEV